MIASGTTNKKNTTGAVITKNAAPPTIIINQIRHPSDPLFLRLLIILPPILYYTTFYGLFLTFHNILRR